MNRNLFYEISSDYFYYAEVIVMKDLKFSIPCPICGDEMQQPYEAPFDYMIKGKRIPDLQWTINGYYLVSPQVEKAFIENEVTGVDFYSNVTCLKWLDRKDRIIKGKLPDFKYMTVTSKCGHSILCNGRSLPRCSNCGLLDPSVKNIITLRTAFDIDLWDGSDIFSFDNSTIMFCTEKVKKIVEANKFKNFEFKTQRGVRCKRED